MSKEEKLIQRLLTIPSDFKFGELKTLLGRLGFAVTHRGKTSGSRVAFLHTESKVIVRIHKPHPNDELPKAALKEVVAILEENKMI